MILESWQRVHNSIHNKRTDTLYRWPDLVREKTLSDWKERLQSTQADAYIFLDIDDTLVEGLWLWLEYCVELPEIKEKELDIQKLIDSGRPFSLIKEIIGKDNYAVMERFLKFRKESYSEAQYVDPELLQHLEALEAEGQVVGGLTARSGYPVIRRYTKRSLRENALLQNHEVLFRPVHLDYDQALDWKPVEMNGLQKVQAEKPLILVDDSARTATRVGKRNEEMPTVPPIFQVIYQTEINTPEIATAFSKYEEGHRTQTLQHKNGSTQEIYLPAGVYLAKTWSEVPAYVQQAKRAFTSWIELHVLEKSIVR